MPVSYFLSPTDGRDQLLAGTLSAELSTTGIIHSHVVRGLSTGLKQFGALSTSFLYTSVNE